MGTDIFDPDNDEETDFCRDVLGWKSAKPELPDSPANSYSEEQISLPFFFGLAIGLIFGLLFGVAIAKASVFVGF